MATGNQDPEFLTDSLILLQKRNAWEESSNCSFLVFLVEDFFLSYLLGCCSCCLLPWSFVVMTVVQRFQEETVRLDVQGLKEHEGIASDNNDGLRQEEEAVLVVVPELEGVAQTEETDKCTNDAAAGGVKEGGEDLHEEKKVTENVFSIRYRSANIRCSCAISFVVIEDGCV